MDFSFFIKDNKSGYKTREKWLSIHYPELYNNIINYSSKLSLQLNFKEKIWFYFHKITERPKCITCGNDVPFRNRFDKPYGDFCSLKCINDNKKEMIKRQEKTFKRKYNVTSYPKHKDFIKKQRNTKLKKYNNPNYNNSDKAKLTKFIKYDNPNYNNHEKYKLTCINKYGTDNYSKSNSYQKKLLNSFRKKYPGVNIINIKKLIVLIACKKCNKKFKITKQLLYERYKRNYIICTKCNPIGQSARSGYEIQISDFLKKLKINHKYSNRTLLENKELDIYIPLYNLAIEIDGLYWHNELFVPMDYHLKKTIECDKKNIKLLHIFEDEWLYKQDIVKSIIKNKLNKNDKIIYARQCIIKNINSKQAKEFLNNNHIQGSINSKIKLGLYYKNELVSVMTFSKGRIIIGNKNNQWELSRFCNNKNISVVGSAGKLFKHFIKEYNPDKIITYSDIRLFDGNLYKKLGFIKKSQSKPNYWYVINGLRYYRFNFRKAILVKEGFDKNKTEKEIMFDRKIYRIYDCGSIRWEYIK